MKTSLSVSILAIGLAFSPIMTSCAKDRTIEDYRREKTLEEINRFRQSEGLYAGDVRAEATGEAVGVFEAALEADTDVKPAPDGLKYEEVPIYKLRLALHRGGVIFPIVFSKISYETTTRALKGALKVRRQNGAEEDLVLSAVVGEDGRIRGTIGVFGRPRYRASFTLARGAILPGEEERDTDFTSPLTRAFEGAGEFPHLGERPVHLALAPALLSAEEQLVELFSPLKTYRATLTLSKYLEVVMETAEWDDESGQLSGKARLAGHDGQAVDVTLKCTRPSPRSQTLGCEVTGGLRREKIRLALSPSVHQEPGSMPSFHRRIRYVSEPGSIGAFRPDLLIETRLPSRENEVKEVFDYRRPVRLILDAGRDVSLGFDEAVWRLDTRTLTGRTSVIHTGVSHEIQMECQERLEGERHLGWRCMHHSSLTGRMQEFNFRVKKEEREMER